MLRSGLLGALRRVVRLGLGVGLPGDVGDPVDVALGTLGGVELHSDLVLAQVHDLRVLERAGAQSGLCHEGLPIPGGRLLLPPDAAQSLAVGAEQARAVGEAAVAVQLRDLQGLQGAVGVALVPAQPCHDDRQLHAGIGRKLGHALRGRQLQGLLRTAQGPLAVDHQGQVDVVAGHAAVRAQLLEGLVVLAVLISGNACGLADRGHATGAADGVAGVLQREGGVVLDVAGDHHQVLRDGLGVVGLERAHLELGVAVQLLAGDVGIDLRTRCAHGTAALLEGARRPPLAAATIVPTLPAEAALPIIPAPAARVFAAEAPTLAIAGAPSSGAPAGVGAAGAAATVITGAVPTAVGASARASTVVPALVATPLAAATCLAAVTRLVAPCRAGLSSATVIAPAAAPLARARAAAGIVAPAGAIAVPTRAAIIPALPAAVLPATTEAAALRAAPEVTTGSPVVRTPIVAAEVTTRSIRTLIAATPTIIAAEVPARALRAIALSPTAIVAAEITPRTVRALSLAAAALARESAACVAPAAGIVAAEAASLTIAGSAARVVAEAAARTLAIVTPGAAAPLPRRSVSGAAAIIATPPRSPTIAAPVLAAIVAVLRPGLGHLSPPVRVAQICVQQFRDLQLIRAQSCHSEAAADAASEPWTAQSTRPPIAEPVAAPERAHHSWSQGRLPTP